MEQEKTMQEILETVKDLKEGVDFIRENGVTKEELYQESRKLENSIIEHVDQFIGLHQKIDTELTALRNKVERIEEYVQKIAKHVQFDVV
ncbi:hypothetical protein KJ641_00170 [Patescibacteria group bacterium]|nr:hypothetical protein [Patescibacteria group bacterium]MBU1895274.1 hypothetical protein [Patescibacteria group bacterium]